MSDAQVAGIRRSYLPGFPLYLSAGALALASPHLSLLVILGFWILWGVLPHARDHA